MGKKKKNETNRKLQDTENAVLRGNFIAINVYTRKLDVK